MHVHYVPIIKKRVIFSCIVPLFTTPECSHPCLDGFLYITNLQIHVVRRIRYNIAEDNVLVFQGRSLGGIRIENHIRKEACDWMDNHNPFCPDEEGVWGSIRQLVNGSVLARAVAAASANSSVVVDQ